MAGAVRIRKCANEQPPCYACKKLRMILVVSSACPNSVRYSTESNRYSFDTEFLSM
jgi:hypothetical protein